MTQTMPGPDQVDVSTMICQLADGQNGADSDLQPEAPSGCPAPAPEPGDRLQTLRDGRTPATTGHPVADDVVELDVIIPAFNEARRLPSTLLQTTEFLTPQPWRSRIVIVDNGSADDTAEAALRMVDERSTVEIRVLGCARPGKGAAVRRGLLSSNARFVGFFDADLATPVETLAVAVSHLRRGAAAVIGSRHIPGAVFLRMQPLGRRVGGAAFRLMTRTIVREIHDTQCGFKFFERGAVQYALRQCQSASFAFDVELLQRLRRDGGSIVEIPVAWADGSGSTLQPFHDGVAAFSEILSLRRNLR